LEQVVLVVLVLQVLLVLLDRIQFSHPLHPLVVVMEAPAHLHTLAATVDQVVAVRVVNRDQPLMLVELVLQVKVMQAVTPFTLADQPTTQLVAGVAQVRQVQTAEQAQTALAAQVFPPQSLARPSPTQAVVVDRHSKMTLQLVALVVLEVVVQAVVVVEQEHLAQPTQAVVQVAVVKLLAALKTTVLLAAPVWSLSKCLTM